MEKRSMRGSLAIVFLFYYIDMQQNNFFILLYWHATEQFK